MRTTIELTEEQRAELLRLAAKRGIKGFSPLIQEAVNEFLEQETKKLDQVEAALELMGCLEGKSGEEFEARAQAVREFWR